MTKVRAGSFGLDIAGLLADTNHDDAKNQYTKMLEQFNQHVTSVNQDIATHENDMKNIFKEHHDDLSKQMESVRKEANQLANDRDKEIKNIEDIDDQMWNRSIPEQISQRISEAINSVPSSTVYYRGYNGRESINNPSPGDICWESGEWDEAASNALKAQAYRYEANVGWKPIKGDQDIYGSNIFGAEIKGGVITGAFFRSNEQGGLGTPFQVDDHGKIYAQDFKMDLLHHTVTEVNKCAYSGKHNDESDENSNVPAGLNFTNGMLHMTATVDQQSGKYINRHAGEFVGKTYLEPNYLKLRTIGTDRDNSLLGRTDIRGGNLEISDQWSQNTGIMLGYWTDNYTNGQSPEIKLANNMEIYQTSEGHIGLKARHGFIFRQDVDISAGNQLFIHGTKLKDYILRVVKSH